MRCRPRFRRTVMAVVPIAAATMAGCYKHVVRTEGLGTRDVDIYEPNLPEKQNPVESLMWGDEPKKEKGWRDR